MDQAARSDRPAASADGSRAGSAHRQGRVAACRTPGEVFADGIGRGVRDPVGAGLRSRRALSPIVSRIFMTLRLLTTICLLTSPGAAQMGARRPVSEHPLVKN